MEEWRDINGFEGFYQVSNKERVRSVDRIDNNNHFRKGSIMKQFLIGGYYKVGLRSGSKQKHFSVARLVAFAFPEICGEYFEGAEVDHISTIKTDNRPENLRWVTRIQNRNNPLTQQHQSESKKGKTLSEETKKKLSVAHKGAKMSDETKKRMSELRKGKQLNRQDCSKWVIKLSLDNEILHFYPSMSEAERETGVNYKCIGYCCNGKQKTAGGFKWVYAN